MNEPTVITFITNILHMEHRKCHQQIPDRRVLLAFSPATPRRVLTRVVQLTLVQYLGPSSCPAMDPRWPRGTLPASAGRWLVACAAGGRSCVGGLCLPSSRTRGRRCCWPTVWPCMLPAGSAATLPAHRPRGVTSAGRCSQQQPAAKQLGGQDLPVRNKTRDVSAHVPGRNSRVYRRRTLSSPRWNGGRVLRGKPNTHRGRTCRAGFVN